MSKQLRNPVTLYRAKYYLPERADVAFCSPPLRSREEANEWLERKLNENATGGHVEYCTVDTPSNGWYVDPLS